MNLSLILSLIIPVGFVLLIAVGVYYLYALAKHLSRIAAALERMAGGRNRDGDNF